MKALICGISGQDGAYLARHLLEKGYEVVGSSRDAQISNFGNLVRLGIRDKVSVESMALNDFRSVLQVVSRIQPDEIYNLAGQSSVALSFEQPVETLESILSATINLMEAIRFLDRPIRLYNAGSGECFGDTLREAAYEETPFRPRSPYAVAKAAAFWQVANYREAYGLFACTGILFNHESPLRPERFVTRKIIASACRIANGSGERLRLGNTTIQRDWGWAPEYVDAMWRMLQQESAEDFVIATGKSHALSEFADLAFQHFGLDWQAHTDIDSSIFRPTDIPYGCGNAGKALNTIGWKAQTDMAGVVKKMIEAELNKGALCSN
jgi:GDPmannose 4,6-dehydratase